MGHVSFPLNMTVICFTLSTACIGDDVSSDFAGQCLMVSPVSPASQSSRLSDDSRLSRVSRSDLQLVRGSARRPLSVQSYD